MKTRILVAIVLLGLVLLLFLAMGCGTYNYKDKLLYKASFVIMDAENGQYMDGTKVIRYQLYDGKTVEWYDVSAELYGLYKKGDTLDISVVQIVRDSCNKIKGVR